MSKLEMTLDARGEGKLVFTRKGVARPVERTVRIQSDAVADLSARLGRLGFVDSAEVYQSKVDHSNLGTVTIVASQGGKSREVRFNYTENREMDGLVSLLRGLANREVYEDIARQRVADPLPLVPLLREMADDMTLPLIARNRANELANEIEKSKRR
jgi:hypothetical protein